MKKTKQNILIVHNFYQIPGGEDTVVVNEKKLLEDNGHKVISYTRNNSELKEMTKLNKFLLPFTMIFSLKTYRDIKKIIKNENINIVHVHNTLSLISQSVYYAALSCKKPVVQTIHNFRFLCPAATLYRDGHICEDCVTNGLKCSVKHNCYRNSKLQTLACVINTKVHRATGIYKKINYICLTEFNKEKLLSLKQIKPQQVFVKPNFIDNIEQIIPYEQRENQYIFVGRLDKLKGIDLLLEAWSKMNLSKTNLVICGNGPMEQWCKNYIEDNNLINVKMQGFIANQEVRKIIAKSKALILPTQLYEGFPMTIVEAFSVGTPVICSDLGNAGSVVEEGITGYKFKCNSVEELINSANRCSDLCLTILDIYKKQYTGQPNYKTLTNIYRSICK